MTQQEYIAILFDDCGFDLAARRVWLRAEFGRPYADELSKAEKHQCIERLKEIKASRSEPTPANGGAAETALLPFE